MADSGQGIVRDVDLEITRIEIIDDQQNKKKDAHYFLKGMRGDHSPAVILSAPSDVKELVDGKKNGKTFWLRFSSGDHGDLKNPRLVVITKVDG